MICSVAFPSCRGHCVRSAPKNREEPEEQTEHDAENDAGDDGEIKRGMPALDPNVAGQSAQPFRRETAPHHQSNECGNHTDDHDEFSQLAHHAKSCVIHAEAQA
jgi:hypothetical protein